MSRTQFRLASLFIDLQLGWSTHWHHRTYFNPNSPVPFFSALVAICPTRESLRSWFIASSFKLRHLNFAEVALRMATSQNEQWFLKSKKPVSLPKHQALDLSDKDFDVFVKSTVVIGETSNNGAVDVESCANKDDVMTQTTEASVSDILTPPSTTEDVREVLSGIDLNIHHDGKDQAEDGPVVDMENKMFTENSDVAYRSTKNALVDLFAELEDVVSGPRLIELLNLAWDCDPDATLKIIFNARSIHLGKSSRHTFYRCAGWLFQKHPATLITNLRWLSRPVIQKKVEEKEGEDSDKAVFVEVAEVDENDPAHYDVRNGVSHGYWKDLVNILALAVNGKLDPLADPKDVLNVHQGKDDWISRLTQKEAKEKRRATSDSRHKMAVEKFENDPNYRALHLTVARLFAEQLKIDLGRLRDDKPQAKRNISLCAKWAPTAAQFHDKHTYITSTIAETLDHSSAADQATKDRERFIRHVRECYRKDVSALRKELEVVERDMSANTFENIHYSRVPSIAMKNYTPIFVKKDEKRFDEYITKVAEGSANISGAVLSPSVLVKSVQRGFSLTAGRGGKNDLVEEKIAEMQVKVADGQWKTLVQRIRDSGTLENSIAVCDVSGSMSHPTFKDKTCPMDSAIGLSLLVAEVCKPPFGGTFITFSTDPSIQSVDLKASLSQKVAAMKRADWGMSTDFAAVFEKLVLPMALKHRIKPEDMVKRVFVFSDMHFDQAEWTKCEYNDDGTLKEDDTKATAWSTSYERIQNAYRAAGYEMPELVFWNLAGGRAGLTGHGDPTAPKPVTAAMEGTALVSGYSQGMLKVFLDGGGFEDPEDEDEDLMEVVKGEDGEEVDVQENKRRRKDPFDTVRKAISHQAYSMLKVVD